jgi:dolichyl-phosphate-mannose--protein O-mannosyl transferase
MLPENNVEYVRTYGIHGGLREFIDNIVHYKVYVLGNLGKGYPPYTLSNNQFLLMFFLGFTFLLILSVVAIIVRFVQKVQFETPVMFTDRSLLFLYFVSFSLLLPWMVAPRIQYNFYYVPAFPFILLLTTKYVFTSMSRSIQVLYIVMYMSFFFYNVRYIIPI